MFLSLLYLEVFHIDATIIHVAHVLHEHLQPITRTTHIQRVSLVHPVHLAGQRVIHVDESSVLDRGIELVFARSGRQFGLVQDEPVWLSQKLEGRWLGMLNPWSTEG